ncbi:MAG: PilZ domain-containing protein [Angelakisella sp.]
MQPLPKDYELSVCEVKTLDNELLIAGYISEVTDEYVQIGTFKGERLPLVRFDLPLKISIHNAKKGFRVLGGVCYLSTDNMLRVVNVDNLQDFERRSFFRVPVSISAKMMAVPDEYDKAHPDMNPPEEIPVDVNNISLSGLLFTPTDTRRSFFMGDRFIIELPLDNVKLTLNIKVCRYEEYENKPKRYGCEFYGYTQKQSDRLCSYIFGIERNMIRKKKDI